jgi:hypothetical protein
MRDIAQMQKDVLSEFCWDNGVEKTPLEISPTRRWAPACRNTILRENRQANAAFPLNNFAQQPWLRSRLYLLPPRWRQLQAAPVKGGAGWDKKSALNIFQSGQIQHLHIELRNESLMALLAPVKWGQKHETMKSQEVCGLSTIEKHDLHKNDKSV